MVKMITLCHRFDTVRTPPPLYLPWPCLPQSTALGSLESVGQEAGFGNEKELFRPSESAFIHKPIQIQKPRLNSNRKSPQTSPEPEVLMRGPLHEAFAEAYLADPPTQSGYQPEATC